MADKQKIGAALKRLLTFGVLFGTQAVKTTLALSTGDPVTASASLFSSGALLDAANTLAGGVAGNSLYDSWFKSSDYLEQNKDLQRVASEAVIRLCKGAGFLGAIDGHI